MSLLIVKLIDQYSGELKNVLRKGSYFDPKRFKYIDQYQQDALPEYIYAGKNVKPHSRLYVMGVSNHGGLGVRQFLQPKKHRSVYHYMQRPHRLNFANKFKVVDIACGYGFTTFAIKSEDKIPSFFGTGITSNSQIGVHTPRKGNPLEFLLEPAPIDVPFKSSKSKTKKVACGRAHTLLYTDEEGLWTLGNNAYGQCGRPIVHEEDYSVKATYHQVKQFDKKKVDQIECGQDTSFVLSEGILYSCGWSADGQTGRNTFENVDSFGVIEGDLKGEFVVKVASRGDCVLALTEKGEVFGWGNSEYKQFGIITHNQQISTPTALPFNVGKIVDIGASGTACFIVNDSGEVWSWGYGILGRGPNERDSTEPVLIPSTLLGRNVLTPNSKVVKIYTGMTMAAAITDQGGLYTWGRNTGGCLGLGHTNDQHFPMRVCISALVQKVSCGIDHMVILAKSLV